MQHWLTSRPLASRLRPHRYSSSQSPGSETKAQNTARGGVGRKETKRQKVQKGEEAGGKEEGGNRKQQELRKVIMAPKRTLLWQRAWV